MVNPVHCEDGKWYFWIETLADRCGPFENECDAQLLCESYMHSLNTGESWDKNDLDKYLKIILLQFYYAGTLRDRVATKRVINFVESFIS